jgi:hypothetical protein
MHSDPGAIDDYIKANRGTYTDQAIRDNLVAAGHQPAAIDQAFERLGVEASAGQPRKPATGLVTFAWILFVLGGLFGLFGFGAGGSYTAGASIPIYVLIFAGVGLLLIFLLRWAVPRFGISGIGAGLIGLALVPIFGALLIGSCAAAFATRVY